MQTRFNFKGDGTAANVARFTVIAIIYFLSARLGLALVAQPENIATIWLPSGVALAALLLAPRAGRITLSAIFVTNALANVTGGNSLAVSLGFAFANTLEAACAFWVLRRFSGAAITFTRVREVVGLILVAVGVNAATALVGALVPTFAFGAPFWNTWLIWWVADGLGILLITPLIVLWALPHLSNRPVTWRRVLEAALLTAGLGIAAQIVFALPALNPISIMFRPILIMPILMYGAFRFSPRGITVALLMVGVIAVMQTLNGTSPFAMEGQSMAMRAMSVQIFLGVVTMTILLLSAIFYERERAQSDLRRERDFALQVMNTMGQGLTITDEERRFVFVNPAYSQMMGYTPAEMMGKQPVDVTAPEDHAGLAHARAARRAGKTTTYESRLVRKGGGVIPVSITGAPRWRDGKVVGAIAVITDLTEQKRAQEELRASEEKFFKTFQHAPMLITLSTVEDGTYLDVNDKFVAVSGFTREEIIGKTSVELGWISPEQRARLAQLIRAHGHIHELELTLTTKDQRQIICLLNGELITIDGKVRLLSIAQDVTERKRAERALIESNALNESLLQTIPFGMDIVDQSGTILFANEKLRALFGADLHKHTCWQMYKDDQTQCITCPLKQPIALGETHISETAGVLNGKIFAIYHTGMIYQGKQAILEVFQDITENKLAEARVRDSEERYRLLFREMIDGFALHEIICDDAGAPVDYRFLEANPAFERLTGLRADAIIGKTVREVIPGIEPEWIAKYGRVALTGEPIQFENYARALGKHYQVTAFSPRPHQFATIFEDVTERKAAEERSIQLGQILEESRNEIYIFDAQTLHFIQVNRGARENLGYSMDELRELTPIDLKPEFTRDSFEAHIQSLRARAGEQLRFESMHRRKNGTMYPVEVSLQLTHLASLPVFVAMILDITARRQRERELQAIASISAALRAAHTRAEMLPVILEQVAGLIPVEGAAIGLLNATTGEVVIEQARGVWQNALGRRTPRDQGVTRQVLTTGKPYVTNDLPSDPAMYWRDLAQTATAMATVPLATQNDVIGWIGISTKNNISETDLRVLGALADIAANALHRSASHEQTKRHLDRITALGIIDRAINASLDLRIVLNILLDQAVTHLRADAAALLLFNRATQTLEWRAERGMRAINLPTAPFHLGSDATSRAIIERRAIHIPDLGAHSDTPARAPLLAPEEFVSYYVVPLIAKGVVKGVLEIFHRAPHTGDDEWNGFLQSLAEQAAIALDNAELFSELERANDELVMAYDATIEGWSRALDLRDKETEGHSRRVTEMTVQLARAFHIPDDQLVLIRRGALLHDIGKMGIPDAILLKPGPLSEKEWETMRLHPAYANELLSGIGYLGNALDIPYCHHEKWDGTGYPRGLAGEAIPIAARIFALADVWDALSSERPYRAAWPPDRVIAYIREQSGKHFDPAVVAAFLNLTHG